MSTPRDPTKCADCLKVLTPQQLLAGACDACFDAFNRCQGAQPLPLGGRLHRRPEGGGNGSRALSRPRGPARRAGRRHDRRSAREDLSRYEGKQ